MHSPKLCNKMPLKSCLRLVSLSVDNHTNLVKLLIFCFVIRLSTQQPYARNDIRFPTSQHVVGNHRSACLSSTIAGSTSTRMKQRFCAPPFICYNSSCVCPLGHASPEQTAAGSSSSMDIVSLHQRSLALYLQRSHAPYCVPFDAFTCTNDVQCQDIDLNVVCHNSTQICRCRRGYERNSTGFCSKLEQRNPTPSPVIDPFKTRLFFADQACIENRDCDGDYVYCSNGICKCWPEFYFLIAASSRTNSIDNGAINGSTIGDSNQSINDTRRHESTTSTTGPGEATSISGVSSPLGHCVRKLCDSDDECQTDDNPNLVCNNTICECRYGYIMYRESKTCMRYVIKRQSCDLTCRIIGGLFATIFMLTLIYWCCYCCYSIVKNYRNYRSHCEIVTSESYVSRNNRRRHNSGETSFSGRLTASVSNFLRAQIVDEPPSYLQAMADEMLPDYDAALEIQRLNKSPDDSVSVTTHCTLTLDGTDDCHSIPLDQSSDASQQNTNVYDDNKLDSALKMSY